LEVDIHPYLSRESSKIDEIMVHNRKFGQNGGYMTNKSEINIKRASIIFKNY